jgi:hypothetical protein
MIAGFGILSGILLSCVNSNKTYLENILKPGVLHYLKDGKQLQVSSRSISGENNGEISIPVGKEITIFHFDGPAVINHIFFKVKSSDPYFLRRILLKMYWDNEENPSVEVPFGDFFGSGFAYSHFVTPYLSMSSGEYSCSFPMPFEEQGKIVIVNETGQDIQGLYYLITYRKVERHTCSNTGYFHAYWHRDVRTDYDSNYTILSTQGRGYVVGAGFSVQAYDSSFNFQKGNLKVIADGENKPIASPFSGMVLKDDSSGRLSVSQFYTTNPIQFNKSINFTIEHGHNNVDVADFSSTVYWYQTEPHVKFSPMLKSGLRIPLRIVPPTAMIEAEQQKFNLGKIPSKVMDMTDFGTEWGGSKQLLIESGLKDEFSLFLTNLEETGYAFRVYYTQGPDYGNADVYMGTEKVGQIDGYAPFIRPGGYIPIPDFRNLYNGLPLKFVVTGKDSLSGGYFVGLDGIKLEPKRTFIQEWNVIGPFEDKSNPMITRPGIDSVYPPEIAIDRNQGYKGSYGMNLRWQVINTQADGFLSFQNMITPGEPAVFYALVYIQSPQPRQATLMIGSEDAVKIIYNHKGYKHPVERTLNPDQDKYSIKINRGWNTLLLKIETREGRAGFYARIPDREDIFRYSTSQYSETDNGLEHYKHKWGR